MKGWQLGQRKATTQQDRLFPYRRRVTQEARGKSPTSMEMKDKRAGKYAQNMRGGIKVRYTENSSEGLALSY